MIIPKNIKNQMKSTRLHLAKGIKLIQRLLRSKPLFLLLADASTIRGYATTIRHFVTTIRTKGATIRELGSLRRRRIE